MRRTKNQSTTLKNDLLTSNVTYFTESNPQISVCMKVVNKSPNELPKMATEGSAAMDVRAWCRNEHFMGDGAEWDEVSKCIRIFSGGRAAIPTGLYFDIPKGYELQIRPRSGMAIKQGIEAHFGTIDSDFKNEVCVILFNISSEPFEVHTGDRIAQLLLNKLSPVQFEEVDELEQTNHTGFGSSGTK